MAKSSRGLPSLEKKERVAKSVTLMGEFLQLKEKVEKADGNKNLPRIKAHMGIAEYCLEHFCFAVYDEHVQIIKNLLKKTPEEKLKEELKAHEEKLKIAFPHLEIDQEIQNQIEISLKNSKDKLDYDYIKLRILCLQKHRRWPPEIFSESNQLLIELAEIKNQPDQIRLKCQNFKSKVEDLENHILFFRKKIKEYNPDYDEDLQPHSIGERDLIFCAYLRYQNLQWQEQFDSLMLYLEESRLKKRKILPKTILDSPAVKNKLQIYFHIFLHEFQNKEKWTHEFEDLLKEVLEVNAVQINKRIWFSKINHKYNKKYGLLMNSPEIQNHLQVYTEVVAKYEAERELVGHGIRKNFDTRIKEKFEQEKKHLHDLLKELKAKQMKKEFVRYGKDVIEDPVMKTQFLKYAEGFVNDKNFNCEAADAELTKALIQHQIQKLRSQFVFENTSVDSQVIEAKLHSLANLQLAKTKLEFELQERFFPYFMFKQSKSKNTEQKKCKLKQKAPKRDWLKTQQKSSEQTQVQKKIMIKPKPTEKSADQKSQPEGQLNENPQIDMAYLENNINIQRAELEALLKGSVVTFSSQESSSMRMTP